MIRLPWQQKTDFRPASEAEIVAFCRARLAERPTPQATIDALMFGLRRGLSCLSDPEHLDRLKRCDQDAIEQIAKRLRSWKAKKVPWLPAYTDDTIATLIKVWRALKERQAA